VADLLECLIQIKGVADTPRRLALRLAAQPQGDVTRRRGARVARWMAEAEPGFARCLDLMLAEDRAELPELPRVGMLALVGEQGPDPLDWQAAFAAARAQTVEVLDRCSAEQLGRIGLEPSRGPMTVADLVALMLAHDTDCLGDIDAFAPLARGSETRG
jgi:hypothetical protein